LRCTTTSKWRELLGGILVDEVVTTNGLIPACVRHQLLCDMNERSRPIKRQHLQFSPAGLWVFSVSTSAGMSAAGEASGLESLPQAWHVYFRKGRTGFASPY